MIDLPRLKAVGTGLAFGYDRHGLWQPISGPLSKAPRPGNFLISYFQLYYKCTLSPESFIAPELSSFVLNLSSFFQPFNAAITSSVARRAGLCGYFLYSAILTQVVSGKTRRARVLRKQDPWSGRFFRLDANVRITQLWSNFLHFIVLILSEICPHCPILSWKKTV